ncbi:MAG: hypothetical protein JXA73_13795 [Acidobacteria bacterium]|nr:hypothetical protein [Acidobacteriota bacterium]
MEDSEEKRLALLKKSELAYHHRYSGRHLGPRNILMKFKNINPLRDPKISASRYEDSFQDVGREEMERRFSERRKLFLEIYKREQPRQSLSLYMKAAQSSEGYKYKPAASAGPASLFLGGSVPKKHQQKGELPECQLLGFIDGKKTVGCLAHPLAETSQGYDGRDHAGFFHHTNCCRTIGCEAGKEFKFLSASAMRIFDKAVAGISWYEYSRHATSVLVYYLRSYDCLLQRLEERELLDWLTLEQLVEFTNILYDEWPLMTSEEDNPQNTPSCKSDRMTSLDILSTDMPLAERIMYLALDTRFLKDHFAGQLQQARDHIEKHMEALRRQKEKDCFERQSL